MQAVRGRTLNPVVWGENQQASGGSMATSSTSVGQTQGTGDVGGFKICVNFELQEMT